VLYVYHYLIIVIQLRSLLSVDIRPLPCDQIEVVLHSKSRNIFNFFVRALQRSDQVTTRASLTWYTYNDSELTENPKKAVVVNKRKRSN